VQDMLEDFSHRRLEITTLQQEVSSALGHPEFSETKEGSHDA
jgi:hypothetical protein